MMYQPMEIIKGCVVRGNGLGHGFGFPTANIEPLVEPTSPDGVYMAEIVVDDVRHGAVVNIGRSPSVVLAGRRRVEAHILDFRGDIYGRRVELRLLKFLRSERKFSSREELVAQIAADRDLAQMLYISQFVNKL